MPPPRPQQWPSDALGGQRWCQVSATGGTGSKGKKLCKAHNAGACVGTEQCDRSLRFSEYIFSSEFCLLNCCLDSLPLGFNVFCLQGQTLPDGPRKVWRGAKCSRKV